MKTLNRIILAVLTAAACSLGAAAQGFVVNPQPVSTVSGKVDGASKSELMSRLKRWVALTFDRSDVIDMTDENAGTVVLKWSAPLQQPSGWLSASLSETCVIDMRDGGAWRLQVYAPRILWAPTETASMLEEMGLSNSEANADNRMIADISKKVFGGSMDWPLGEQVDAVAALYLDQLNGIEQFRNERDKERGKSTDEYRAAERRWRIINDARRGAEQYNLSLAQSLGTALAVPVDF